MPERITSDHRDALLRYKEKCERDFEFVGFLDYRGDESRLPRDKCFIGRSTLDAVSGGKKQEKSGSSASADSQQAQKLEPLRDTQLIDRIRQRKLKNVFITGDGGMGKTEYTRLIAYRLAVGLNVNQQPLAIPYRVELKSISGEFRKGSELYQALLGDDAGWLTPFVELNQVVFILDGLDELGVSNRDQFDRVLSDLMSSPVSVCRGCTFVLAGRPGSLGGLDQLFPDSAKHTLKPLVFAEIQSYVDGYFAHRKQPHLAPKLMAEIQSRRRSLFPLIQTPFMLAFACDGYFDPKQPDRREIPSNPAKLIEAGLKRIFSRRRHEARTPALNLPQSDELCLEALSTLAAFMLVEPTPGKPTRLSFSAEEAENWLLQNRSFFEARDISYSLLNDGHAKELLGRIAPQSGVLVRTDDRKFAFTNRVVAEFLAARWIVRHGYPNWPYGSENAKSPYTKPAADPEAPEQQRIRQIMDFAGDHVWSINHRPLIQGIWFELGRCADGGSHLMRFIRWTCRQIQSLDTSYVGSLDAYRTLVGNVFGAFRALSDSDVVEHHQEIVASAHRLIPPVDNWWDDFAVENVQYLPPSCATEYSGLLMAALDAVTKNPKQNWITIYKLAYAITSGFAPDARLVERGSDAVGAALEAVSKKTWQAIGYLVDAVATGSIVDAKLKKRAFDALVAALKMASENPSKDAVAIGYLAGVIASGFAADAKLKEQARDALAAVLAATSNDPQKNCDAIRLVSVAIGQRFDDDSNLKEYAGNLLGAALKAASEKPKNNWYAIHDLAGAIASYFAADAKLTEQAFDALVAALEAASKDLKGGYWIAINELSVVIASVFGANAKLKERAWDALAAAIDPASQIPVDLGIAITISRLADLIGSGSASDSRSKQWVRDALSAALDATGKDPKKNWYEIRHLSTAIASNFGADENLMERAYNAIAEALDTVSGEPKKEYNAISSIVGTIACHFAANTILKKRADAVLAASLDAVSDDPKGNRAAISSFAGVIVSDFASDAKLKEQALFAMLAALDAAIKDGTQDEACDNLASAIASDFSGNLQAAVGIIRAGRSAKLNNVKWNGFVTVLGRWEYLCHLAGLQGERWGLSSSEPIIEMICAGDSGGANSTLAVLVAPREKIRNGLSPELLARIVEEEQHFPTRNLPVNGNLSPKGNPFGRSDHEDTDEPDQMEVPTGGHWGMKEIRARYTGRTKQWFGALKASLRRWGKTHHGNEAHQARRRGSESRVGTSEWKWPAWKVVEVAQRLDGQRPK